MDKSFRVKVIESRAFLTDRVPFGLSIGRSQATGKGLHKAIRMVQVDVGGKQATGWGSAFIMPGWFDPKANPADHEEAMKRILSESTASAQDYYNAQETWAPFLISDDRGDELRKLAIENKTTRLAGQEAYALEEKAMIDAISRALEKDAFDLFLHHNGFDLSDAHTILRNFDIFNLIISSWDRRHLLPWRHTIGLDDPLQSTSSDGGGKMPLSQIIEEKNITRFKIKINDVLNSISRLEEIASVIGANQPNSIYVTIDANQSLIFEQLWEFVRKYTSNPRLNNLRRATDYIEQPWASDYVLTPKDARVLASITRESGLRILIDESDFENRSYMQAIGNNVYGVSGKGCKGVVKVLKNAALASVLNRNSREKPYFVTVEDLTEAEITDGLQTWNLASALRMPSVAQSGVESNGWLQTRPGEWLTVKKRFEIARDNPFLYDMSKEDLLLRHNGQNYDVSSLTGPGLGGIMNLDPSADFVNVRELSK